MIFTRNQERKMLLGLLAVAVVASAALLFSRTSYAATTIGTNIQTDGTISATGTITSKTILFGNGFSIASTTGATPEITVSDANSNAVLIFDQN